MTPAKARRAINAIVAVLECDDLDDMAVIALEDARAALHPYDEED